MLETGKERCPFQDALEILGKRHVLTILWVLQQRSPRRFTGVKQAVGVNAVTLSERLRELEAAGIISRAQYAETPPRVEYDLTKRGRGLLVILDDLSRWATRTAPQ